MIIPYLGQLIEFTWSMQLAENIVDFVYYINSELKWLPLFTVFTKDFPARSCVQVAKLPMNAKVEIEVVALTGDVQTVSI